MLTFKKHYFLLMLLLLLAEVLIALFLHDPVIRPYGGDFLVVILIYCFARTFINAQVEPTALGVLLFSYLIELLQYFKLVKLLGLQNNPVAVTIIGNYFAWTDLLAYTLGIATVLFAERKYGGKQM